ncbi:MAG: PaaI family thioesterase [Rubrivivax sp.]
MSHPDHHETLERWRAEEAALRVRQQPPGVSSREQASGLSGLELMRGVLEGHLPSAPIGATLHFVLVHVARGEAVFQGKPDRSAYNPLGTVHGGWFATLLDSAVGCAVHTLLPAGKGYTTLELKVNLVRALTERVPLVRAEGRVVHAGSQVATAEGRLVGHDGKLYGHASTTCLIFDARG